MMKKIILILALIFTFCMGLTPTARAQEEDEAFRLAFLGDSLAAGYNLYEGEGFINLLQNVLVKDGLDNVKIINGAVSGYKTSDGLAIVDSILEQHPHAAIIELGINDVLQGVNEEQIRDNLEVLILKFTSKNIPVMLIGIRPPLVSDIRDREELLRIYSALAKKYKLALYPHFLDGVLIERMGTYDFKYIQNDTLHPNAEGVRIMLRKTYPTIKKFLMSL